MRHAVQVLSLLVLLAVSASCTPRAALDPTAPPPPETRVEVWNQDRIDMTLYVTNRTHRIRLGLVPGASTRTFVIPPHLLFSTNWLAFQADPIGDSALPVSEEFQVNPGDHIGLTLRR